MSTIEDFENAPVGATATGKATGIRAMKVARVEERWVLPSGLYVDDESMERWDYTLDPATPATAREALDLAWELAHEVKEGQVIPVGAWLVDRRYNKILVEKNTCFDIAVDEWGAENIRTLEPLPEPLPDWLDAPAVIATTCWCPQGIWLPETGGHWKCARCREDRHWSELRDVTPLYPEEGQDA